MKLTPHTTHTHTYTHKKKDMNRNTIEEPDNDENEWHGTQNPVWNGGNNEWLREDDIIDHITTNMTDEMFGLYGKAENIEFFENESVFLSEKYNLSHKQGVYYIAVLMSSLDSFSQKCAFTFLDNHEFDYNTIGFFHSRLSYVNNTLLHYACEYRNFHLIKELHLRNVNFDYECLYILMIGNGYDDDYYNDYSEILQFVMQEIVYYGDIFSSIYNGKCFSEIIDFEKLNKNVQNVFLAKFKFRD